MNEKFCNAKGIKINIQLRFPWCLCGGTFFKILPSTAYYAPWLALWEKVEFFLSPCRSVWASLLGWHAMVFADKANLLLGAWRCASTLLSILMKLFRFSPYMSGHWVISIEIRSICIRFGFGVAKNCKCYESWYSCLGLKRRVMWNIKRDNPAAIQFCWSGSDKQYWVKRRKQYSSSSKVCNNILQSINWSS